MRINHNVSSLNTYRQLSSNQAATNKNIEKLSSGLRINRAGDDAAGLAISEKMRSQIRGLDMASKNAQDGISLIQTTEGALNETHSILQRMRELAVQSANGTNTDADRSALQDEMNQLTSEINRIGNTTEFNTKKLLNGELNTTAASGAKVTGGSIEDLIKLVGTATKGNEEGSALTGELDIHGARAGTATGTVDVSAGVTVTAADNELTLEIDGQQTTISIAATAYADGDALAAALQTALQAKGGAFASATVTDLGAGKGLQIASGSTGTASNVKIVGGNFANTWLSDAGDMSDITTASGEAANNSLDVTINGVKKTLTLTPPTAPYDTTVAADMTALVASLNTQLDAAFGTGNAVASWDSTNKTFKIESQSTGSTSTVSVDPTSSAASLLGLGSGATKTDGVDKNNELTLKVDGTDIVVDLGTGDTNANVIAATIQNAISAAGKSATVSFADGKLSILDNTTGSASSISITDDAAAKSLGLSASKGLTSEAGRNAASNDLMFQIGANNGQGMAITIGDMRSQALGISGIAGGTTTVSGASFTTTNKVTNGTNNTTVESALDISTSEKSTAAIEVLDKAVAKVSTERSRLGAAQNRLEHTINNLNTSSENLTAAESRIRDTDMAKEMMEQTKNNILAQAAQAMLAQANQQPQGVLQLLR